MKRAIFLLCAFLAAGLAAMPAIAGDEDHDPVSSSRRSDARRGEATVQILRSVAVTKTANLNFGALFASARASTVRVRTNGARVCGPGLNCLGTASAGAFAIAGIPGESVSVSIDDPTVTLSDGASHAMPVTLSVSARHLTLAGGNATVRIGGLLKVAANQPAGVYSGQYSISVHYQ
ncbi:hypothetical protein GGR44_001357 [Sphingobium fontiphilum]|uniref:DUF4402 domain-containing protein n=1 Tax=Sphingobium fontiphilum TaxID=944425 RepID=A0A7W6GNE4_9SPHN|nr:DUF4402 domain-containing protein [Sphingobium fontiphilum]MBB3981710.1 hypothetical protein [Sphingobium fontiphilum]